MKTNWMLTVSLAAAVIACAMTLHAASTRVVGVVTGIIAGEDAQSQVQLTSRGAASTTIRVDADTAFMKWTTHKPWQSGDRLDASALVAGRCAEVELRAEGSNFAKVVRINNDAAGSVFDPCRDRR